MGSCIMTDNGNNLSDIFVDGKEVISYDSPEDCLEKLNYLKENHNISKEIGAAGKSRVLKDHSLQKRCELINEFIQDMLTYPDAEAIINKIQNKRGDSND